MGWHQTHEHLEAVKENGRLKEEVKRLIAEAAGLRTLLAENQWSARGCGPFHGERMCAQCRRLEFRGHAADCRLVAALKENA